MPVTLQAVSVANWQALIALEVALDLRLAPLAVYADDTPVGLVLYNTSPAFDRFFIMRLMIDQQQQGIMP